MGSRARRPARSRSSCSGSPTGGGASVPSTEEATATAGRGRVGALVVVALIVAGCILQVALSLRDSGDYGAEVGKVPSWCVPAATARALGLSQTVLCPSPGPAEHGS